MSDIPTSAFPTVRRYHPWHDTVVPMQAKRTVEGRTPITLAAWFMEQNTPTRTFSALKMATFSGDFRLVPFILNHLRYHIGRKTAFRRLEQVAVGNCYSGSEQVVHSFVDVTRETVVGKTDEKVDEIYFNYEIPVVVDAANLIVLNRIGFLQCRNERLVRIEEIGEFKVVPF